MRRATFTALVAMVLIEVTGVAPALANPARQYEVVGGAEDDMLKMRAGPGVGYRIIVGLPNGTIVRVYSCEQTGGTRWCRVSLKQARGLKGYVSWAYLKAM